MFFEEKCFLKEQREDPALVAACSLFRRVGTRVENDRDRLV